MAIRIPSLRSRSATRSTAYSLPTPPRSISIPSRRRKTVRFRRETAAASTRGRRAEISRDDGIRPVLKSQARLNAPTVGSNRPPVRRARSSADSTSVSVSSSTATGVRPAFRLISDTTLDSPRLVFDGARDPFGAIPPAIVDELHRGAASHQGETRLVVDGSFGAIQYRHVNPAVTVGTVKSAAERE